MPTITNKDVFAGKEFGVWATKTGLHLEERYCIDNYLDKNGKTVEAGTGAGRILLEMRKMGFKSLHGYDFVPQFIDEAKRRDSSGEIQFDVHNAISPDYPDGFFDQSLYVQQILCIFEEASDRQRAIREAHRIVRDGGVAVFSFLSFESRLGDPLRKAHTTYIQTLRRMRKSNRPIQLQPWYKQGGRRNMGALLDAPPFLYYYRAEEAWRTLRATGFEPFAVGSSFQIRNGYMHDNVRQLLDEPIESSLYVVCRKPV